MTEAAGVDMIVLLIVIVVYAASVYAMSFSELWKSQNAKSRLMASLAPVVLILAPSASAYISLPRDPSLDDTFVDVFVPTLLLLAVPLSMLTLGLTLLALKWASKENRELRSSLPVFILIWVVACLATFWLARVVTSGYMSDIRAAQGPGRYED
jgi:hypothetical protein